MELIVEAFVVFDNICKMHRVKMARAFMEVMDKKKEYGFDKYKKIKKKKICFCETNITN